MEKEIRVRKGNSTLVREVKAHEPKPRYEPNIEDGLDEWYS